MSDAKDIVCIDCHGQHRLKIRTVRWDKQTKELIVRKPGKCEVDEDCSKDDKDPDDACESKEKLDDKDDR